MMGNIKDKVMKPNEAPERIWIDSATDLPKLSGHIDKDSIEYIRVDALIEKAKKWFIEHTNISQEIEINEDGEPLANSYIKYAKARFDAANEIFEDFKNYMKGE